MPATRGHAAVLALAVSAVLGAGCAPASSGDPEDRVHVRTPAGSAVRHTTDEARADLLLWVTNQSFEDAEVGLTVRIDDVPVADGTFTVQDEHNWVVLPLLLDPGEHEVTAVATNGTRTTETFEIPANGEQRYAVLSYAFSSADALDRALYWTWSEEPLQYG